VDYDREENYKEGRKTERKREEQKGGEEDKEEKWWTDMRPEGHEGVEKEVKGERSTEMKGGGH